MADLLDLFDHEDFDTRWPISVDRVMSGIPEDTEQLVIISRNKNGEFNFAGTHPDLPKTLWMIESAKKILTSYM